MIPFYADLVDRFHELHTEIENAIESLPSEAMEWSPGPEMNSVSVLIVHLTGAARFLVGDIVMGEPSDRNREAEFQVSGLGKEYLLKRLRDTEAYIKTACESLNLADLGMSRTHPRRGHQVSVAWALLHALEHTGIHAGHIELTSQLWKQRQNHSQLVT